MRIKTFKVLITFPSTAQALHMEQCCREKGAVGRLIPVPREISAGLRHGLGRRDRGKRKTSGADF